MRFKTTACIAVFIAAFSCDKAAKQNRAQASDDAPAKAPSVPEKRNYLLPEPARLVAIGDLHGDLDATNRALKLAGAIDADGHWIGKKLVVVQTGDQLDRGDDELEILQLLRRLSTEAKQAGGAVHALNGNHETMNVAADFRYVTEAGFEEFARVSGSQPLLSRFAASQRGRAAAFLPGGEWAQHLAERKMVLMVGKTVFAHGGVSTQHISYGLDRINAAVSRWMRGESKALPPAVVDPDSPVWTRRYGHTREPNVDCKELAATLKALDAERMVVGHTVQKRGITSACGERVWRIDVGLSSYYGNRPAQVLEIQGSRVTVLTEQTRADTAASQ